MVDSPFDIRVESPASAKLGEIYIVAFYLKNKLWSLERVVLSTEISDSFLITGGTSITYEVSSFAAWYVENFNFIMRTMLK